MNYTPNVNLYKWNQSDKKSDTITEMASNADKIDAALMSKASTDHNATHELGGADEVDLTKLRNYKEQVDDRFTSVNASLADIATTIESYGVKNDGSLEDWQIAQNAITDTVTNGKTLVFNAKNYNWYKGFTIPVGTGAVVGKLSSKYKPKTQWTFLHTDNTDCVTYGVGGTGNSTPYFANVGIIGNVNTGYGLNVVGGLSNPKIENIYIGAGGKEAFRLYNVYIANISNIVTERWDGKQVAIIEGCGLINLQSCAFDNSATSSIPSLRIKNSNSVNAFGLNLNGQQGVYFENSQNCYLYGYHETGSQAPVAAASEFAAWFDSSSRRNQVKLQTVSPIIDLGYDNKWESTILSNQFIPINPKKLVNNVKNCCFDQEGLSGLTVGSSMATVIDNAPGMFSGNSVKVTVPTGKNDFFLVPGNKWIDQNYYTKLQAGQKYTIQFSIAGDGDYPNVKKNDSFYVQAYYLYFDQSQGINYAFLPIFKKRKLYQWSFTIPAGATIPNLYSALVFTFTNNTGVSRTVWLTDLIFTADSDSLMPNNLNAIPTTGTWIASNAFPKSNDSGGYKCTDSGTYKTLSIATTANTTASNNQIVITSGNIADFAIGDFITVGVDGNFRIIDITTGTNTLTLNLNVGHTAANAAVTIHNPTFVSF